MKTSREIEIGFQLACEMISRSIRFLFKDGQSYRNYNYVDQGNNKLFKTFDCDVLVALSLTFCVELCSVLLRGEIFQTC